MVGVHNVYSTKKGEIWRIIMKATMSFSAIILLVLFCSQSVTSQDKSNISCICEYCDSLPKSCSQCCEHFPVLWTLIFNVASAVNIASSVSLELKAFVKSPEHLCWWAFSSVAFVMMWMWAVNVVSAYQHCECFPVISALQCCMQCKLFCTRCK